MERFMELSENFMNSVDLQNGVFEEEGLKMLQEYEEKSKLLLMGTGEKMKLDAPIPQRETLQQGSGNNYDGLFNQ
jgi:hypothetical protein